MTKRRHNHFQTHTFEFPMLTIELSYDEYIADVIKSSTELKDYLRPYKHLFSIPKKDFPKTLKAHNLCSYDLETITPEWFMMINLVDQWRLVRKTGTISTEKEVLELFDHLDWWDFECVSILSGNINAELLQYNTVLNDRFVETEIT
mgnify:CR=1 FL=1